ncbi:hypothetical protein nbrc107696_36730 [Gordonia spumicola]|uniref:SWIM-type domain-containing protein n=1 Tax=Gordonia spumicola TaxID=589161 RepID=A0A7I9VD44_9ACTN|nr:hypothetical protein [Gordonia spumicola]GEE03227.1 hypothetical protein nbrc107696_36730 [Gordonia spumicola]
MTNPNAEYGYTRWGRDFLRLVEPTSITRPEPMLPRARSLARTAVSAVVVEGRLIRGTVARGGSASVAYLEFAPMERAVADRLTSIVGPSPTAAALTDDAHRALACTPELTVVDCSCSARTARCIHVLTLLYETVRRVDENPVVALQLTGFHDASDAPVESSAIPRWTPLSALDPQRFYDA